MFSMACNCMKRRFGATIGVLSARPMVAILARYASRFSVRALDLTIDSSLLWVGALLAVVAALGVWSRGCRRPTCHVDLPSQAVACA